MLDTEHVGAALGGAEEDFSERAGAGVDKGGGTPIEPLRDMRFNCWWSKGGTEGDVCLHGTSLRLRWLEAGPKPSQPR